MTAKSVFAYARVQQFDEDLIWACLFAAVQRDLPSDPNRATDLDVVQAFDEDSPHQHLPQPPTLAVLAQRALTPWPRG